jgi:hypothetical protein
MLLAHIQAATCGRLGFLAPHRDDQHHPIDVSVVGAPHLLERGLIIRLSSH